MRPVEWSKCVACPRCNAQPYATCKRMRKDYRVSTRFHAERIKEGRKLAKEFSGDAFSAGPGWRNQYV